MDICLQHYLFRDEEQIISKNKYMGIVMLNIEAIVFIIKKKTYFKRGKEMVSAFSLTLL